MNKKIKLSLVAASALAVLTGCGSTSSDDPVQVQPQSTTISGKAVDGYIKGATVSYDNKTATTGNDGDWNLTIPDADFGKTAKTISVNGGIDTTTGEAFEGTMKTVVPTSTSTTTAVITPLTTLVASVVSDVNNKKSVLEVKESIANGLGLEASTLDNDPVAALKTNEGKAEAQKTVKAILQVQKIVETLSSLNSGSDKNSSLETSAFTSIANSLNNATTKDTNGTALKSAITAAVKTVVEKAYSSNSADANNSIAAITLVQNQLADINASNIIDITKLTATAKAVEVATSQIEKQLSENNATQALKISKTVAVKGLTKLTSEIATAEANGGVDASTYAENIFDKNTTDAADALYTKLENLAESNATNVTIDEMISAISKSDGNITAALNSTDLNTTQVNNIDTTTFTNAFNTATSKAKKAAKVETFTLAGVTTKIGTSGTFDDVTVFTGFDKTLTASYSNFAKRIKNSNYAATFSMRITNSDKNYVSLKVTNVSVTKENNTSAKVIADTNSNLEVIYSKDAGTASVKIETANISKDTFETNSTGALTLNLTSRVNTIRANSKYSSFDNTIKEYFAKEGTYTVESCMTTGILESGFSKTSNEMDCVTGKVIVKKAN